MSHEMNRRAFLRIAGAAGGLAAGGSLASAGPAADGDAESTAHGKDEPMAAYHETARDIPIAGEPDVLVAGAGPAGVVAAIAAARAGASVRLIECNGCLGGTWTAGLLSWVLDSGNKPGILQEILGELRRRDTGKRFGGSIAYEPEIMKLLLERMCLDAGVRPLLHARVVAAGRDAAGRLTHAVTESKSGRQAWAAKAFVDATGDGDLAAQAGCSFDYGHPETGRAQPMSLICMVTGVTAEGITPFVRGLAEPAGKGRPKLNLLAEMKKAGVSPSYAKPTVFHIWDDLFCFMINHEYGVSPFDAAQVTEATMRARAEVFTLIDALRASGGAWKNVRIVDSAEHIGIREGRRVRGLYEVTVDDMVRGARFEDAVCRCRFGIDVHATDPAKGKGVEGRSHRAKPYDIPYRSLVAKDADGLLLAGRCISGDFLAHSSYRVTGDAAALGQAAGAAAALAATTGTSPKALEWKDIAEVVERVGAAREPASD